MGNKVAFGESLCFRAGVHNIRPAGQMWPAKAFYLARKAQNFIYSDYLLEKKPQNGYKNIDSGP